ncbi:homoserine O-acetyltransferase [Paeniglutamicibacter sp. Y32M11]|uniref:homoserine O-acetyltransferase MetX n=1 Tax=Paeniglutamicibacter sp. Y32M11 TaxID=2853258 RepID=UPI001C52ACBE|nr:homoserine O-acetyltransferase [Paeniglutamicibacter sp. Y32M11]QXQ11195.1 homoserine O-acetyltransferase [Paeniglutamicibacter sp. Y32M11]
MSLETKVVLYDAETAAALDFAPDGILRHLPTGAYTFETGGTLPSVVLGYETWGTLNEDASNAVFIAHALTGDSHVARGASTEAGWWDGFIGPGKTVDTDRFFVVAANMIGGCSGTTGPASLDPEGQPWGSRFPFTTIKDSVRLEARLADALGIQAWHTVLGGSMGGARALEWAVEFPERVRNCVVVACTAESSADQIAFAQVQSAAIRLDPDFAGGDYYANDSVPSAGLGVARRLAHVTYRTAAELDLRFGRNAQGEELPVGSPSLNRGRYQVESYLDHQASKLANRFDANSYLVLTEALMSHDVARGHGSLEDALGRVEDVNFLVAAVDSDRLYWPEQSERLAKSLPNPCTVQYITSPIGHDGFLTDIEQLSDALSENIFS